MRTGRNRVTRNLTKGVMLTVVLLSIASAVPATATEMDPNDFDVQVEMGEEFDPPQPDCNESGACTVEIDQAVYDSRSTGTVTALSKNLDGVIRMICDYRHLFSGAFQMSESGQDWIALDGRMRMGCAWFMDFEDKSTLSGMINGSMVLELVGDAPDMVEHTGSFTVDVTAGSGQFAGYVGTGTFDEHFTEQWGGGPGDGAPAAAVRSAFTPSAEDGGMQTELRRTGGFRVRVVTPRARLAKNDATAKLRIVAARGATCSARAIKGDVIRKLGTSEDGNRDGILTFDPILTNRLSRGDWSLRVRCGARVAGDSTSARAAKALEVY